MLFTMSASFVCHLWIKYDLGHSHSRPYKTNLTEDLRNIAKRVNRVTDLRVQLK